MRGLKSIRSYLLLSGNDRPFYERAFSEDGGKTWEVNWIATDTRVSDESDKAQ
jgi:hypothetical protein